MGASYWARWVCNGQVGDLPDLVLPHVLAEGYDLLTCELDQQTFDCGGTMKRISWSLNGGPWGNAPVDLTITYTCSPTRSMANFYWKLSIRPFPATPREQARFEAHLQEQMNRIVARLGEQLARVPAGDDQEAAQEGAGLQACWESGCGTSQEPDLSLFAEDRRQSRSQAIATASELTKGTKVHHGGAHAGGAPHCVLCHNPAVPVVGTNGRYYCLICREHLPHEPMA